NKSKLIEGREIKAENLKDMWLVQLLRSKGAYIDKRYMKSEEIDYDDMVYCVETHNSNFMALDGGYNFWSGNSPSINLDRVSHLITKLDPDGTNFIGKAKILDTPTGNTVKGLLDGGAKLGVSTRG